MAKKKSDAAEIKRTEECYEDPPFCACGKRMRLTACAPATKKDPAIVRAACPKCDGSAAELLQPRGGWRPIR